ncbi:MAG: amidase [Nitrospinota bacterium]
MREDVSGWTIHGLSKRIAAKEISPVEVTEALIRRIETYGPKLKSFITLDAEGALAEARQAEEEILKGNYRGPLHGIPLAYKDLFATKGLKTTSGSKIFKDHVPTEDSTVVARLRQAGAVCLGKLNMSEFAFGATGHNSHYGNCRNPWAMEHVAGGSSSGSGNAVAAGLVMGALGSDTGGSVRMPSCACGIVGLKPTYGRLSRRGVTPLSWSLDHVGPMTRCVEDSAIMLKAMAGRDPLDPTTSDLPVPDYPSALTGEIRGLRLGVPSNYFFEAIDPEVKDCVRKAISSLERLGARVEEVTYPHPQESVMHGLVIMMAESASVHSRLLKDRASDYDPRARALLTAGLYVTATDYLQALRVRARIARDVVREVFGRVEVLLAPTLPIPAPRLDTSQVTLGGEKQEVQWVMPKLTRLSNMVGNPSVTVPCGLSSKGLPIGLQVMGRRFDEANMLRVAHAWEVHGTWKDLRPTAYSDGGAG